MSVFHHQSVPTVIPGYHSQKAYEIQPEDASSILRVAAYHRQDFDRAVISFPPNAHPKSITSTLPDSTAPTTLGQLEKLPLELLHNICLELDVASLFRFRQTNTRARQVLGALHEYRVITTHAIDPLCALLRTGVAKTVILSDFYRLLCTQQCSLCFGSHGNLVHLALWRRCCSSCLRRNHTTIQMAPLSATKLSRKSLARLPTLVTLPGTYSMEERPGTKRLTLVPALAAFSAYREEQAEIASSSALIDRFKMRHRPSSLTHMACCAMPSFDPQTGQIQNGVSCAGCQLALEDDIIRSKGPWACEVRDAVYSHDDFLQHFTRCEQAQLLWTSSKGGTIKPPKLPQSCQDGGFFKPE